MRDDNIKYSEIQRAPKLKRHLCDVKCCNGESASFECEFNGENSSNIDVQWYRNGKLIPLGNDLMMSSISGNVATLLLKQVYCKDEGQYSCIISNVHGSTTSNACLFVKTEADEKENFIRGQTDKGSALQPRSGTSHSSNRIPFREKENTCLEKTSRTSRRKFIPARFSAIPHTRVVEDGETTRFQCSVVGHPVPSVSWYRSDDVALTANSRVCLLEQDDLRILEISNAAVEDEGLYKVVVENEYGRGEAIVRLDVINHRRKHENDGNNRSYEKHYARHAISKVASVGASWAISCNIPDESPFSGSATWYKNGKVLQTSSSIISKSVDCAFQLHFNNLALEDSGVYTCILENTFNKTRCSAELIVLDDHNNNNMSLQPPVFVTGIPRKSRVAEGHEFEFRVKLQGVSPMLVTWFKNDKALPNCKDFEYVNQVSRGEYGLKFKDTFVADSGLYRCQAYNHHGDAQTAGHLIVEEMSVVEESNSTRCKEFENCSGMDKSKNDLLNRPKKIYGVEENNNFHEEELKNGDLLLKNGTNDSVFLPDVGTHVIQNGNLTPATVIEGPADETILLDESVSLIVRYFGNPEPTVKWTKAGRQLTANDRITMTTKNGESILCIEKVTADDGGKYSVHVENECGGDTHTTSLAVEGPADAPNGQPNVIPGDRSATVAWCSPAYDGGRKVTDYTIEMRSYSNSQWRIVVENCHSLFCTVRGLNPGESYIFRIRARNIHGLSAPSLETIPTYITHADVSPSIEQKHVNIQNGEIFTNQYEILEELGKGRYGVVHKIRDKEFSNFYAAKFVRCIKTKDKEKVREEVAIMNVLKHPKLLQLTAAFESSKEIIVVTEYISGGELFERVVADDFTLTERDCILFMRQICEGVAYIHKNNVVHLDLKPENIMCVSRTSHQIKLIDFGLAQKISSDTPVRVLFGTPEFIPPEIINYEPIGTESDMWSVGIICYVLLSGLSPFMGENDAETFANITRADYDFDDEAFSAISEDARDFISSLLIKRKEKRLTAKQCLHHKWLAQHDKTMSCVKLCTDKLKNFIIRRKWQKTGNAIRALTRMATLSAASRGSSSTNSSTSSNSPRVSLSGVYSSRMSSLGEDESLPVLPPNRYANGLQVASINLDDSLDCKLQIPATGNSHRKSVAFKETITEERVTPVEENKTSCQTLSCTLKKSSVVDTFCNADRVGGDVASKGIIRNKQLQFKQLDNNKLISTHTPNAVYNLKNNNNHLDQTSINTYNSKLDQANLKGSTISISPSALNSTSRIVKIDNVNGNRFMKTSKDYSARILNVNSTNKVGKLSGIGTVTTKTADRLKKFEQLSSTANCASKIKKETMTCSKSNFQKARAFWNRE